MTKKEKPNKNNKVTEIDVESKDKTTTDEETATKVTEIDVENKEQTTTSEETPTNEATPANEATFAFQRVYIKDSSFEVPNAPEVFTQSWKPKMELDIKTENKLLSNTDENKTYEVTLTVRATVENEDKVAFLAEVKQTGIFLIGGTNEELLAPLLGSYCPNILFPYAREALSDMASRGSFPQLLLHPINFDAMYHEQLKAKNKAQESA